MEDLEKIGEKIAELRAETGHQWVHVKGFYAITGFNYSEESNGRPRFTPGSGFPLKAFMDVETGEVKIFNADRFKEASNG